MLSAVDAQVIVIYGSLIPFVQMASKRLAAGTTGLRPPGRGVIKKGNQTRFRTGFSWAESVLITGIFLRVSQTLCRGAPGGATLRLVEFAPPLRAGRLRSFDHVTPVVPLAGTDLAVQPFQGPIQASAVAARDSVMPVPGTVWQDEREVARHVQHGQEQEGDHDDDGSRSHGC